MGLILDDGDTKPHDPKSATVSEAMNIARSMVATTGGRIFQIDDQGIWKQLR